MLERVQHRTSDEVFAEFIDRCCARFARHPAYRRKLLRELPEHDHEFARRGRRG